MNIRLITDASRIPLGRHEWNRLVERNETNTPFQTYEWCTSWWKIFGPGNELLLLLLYEDTELIGLAPLMILHRNKSRELRFIGDVNADYCDFIISRDKSRIIHDIVDYLFGLQDQWDAILLRNIPEYSSTAAIVKTLCANRPLHFIEQGAVCPVLILADRDQIKQPRNSRTLRRHLNFFARNGQLDFKIFSSLEDAHEALDFFFDQHIRRWGCSQDPSLFCNTKYKDFYRELLQEAWPAGWIFFSCLQFNEQPIAYHFGFDYNSKIIWYKPSFNIDFHKRSPGKFLIKYLIEHCISNNKEEFDMTLGDEPFKESYTSKVRYNSTLKIFKNKYDYLYNNLILSSKKLAKKVIHNLPQKH
jgi:CelD/BcsL family acetyltransferase involved in cellulose biosynthesis